MQLLQYDEQTTRTQELNIYVPTSGFDYFYLKFITLVSPFRDDGSAIDVKSLNSWFESLTDRFVIFRLVILSYVVRIGTKKCQKCVKKTVVCDKTALKINVVKMKLKNKC